MEKIKIKIISIISVFALMFNIMPMYVFAEDVFVVQTSSVQGLPGESVEISIDIENNPGLTSLVLYIDFDDVLTLENIEVNSELEGTFTLSETLESPVIINWQESFNDFKFESFATLTFKIDENAKQGDIADINVSYEYGDIYNADLEDLEPTIVNGCVNVIEGIPGDISGDKMVNNKDVTMLLRYLAGWDVDILEPALDVSGDASINNKDVTILLRYLAGWDVDIFFSGNVSTECDHEMTMTVGKMATCTEDGNVEYWYCSECNKYFADSSGIEEITLEDTILPATGHTVVIDEAVEPTDTTTGLTEGKHCSVCGEIIQAQEVIPMLEKEEYAITYYVDNNDSYLKSIEVVNSNPSAYASDDGLKLSNLIVDGYIFEGWYDGAGSNGELVKEIPKGTTGTYELYAKWSKVEYSVIFDSPDVPMDSITYTVDKGVTLTNADWYGYTFVGWSNDDGFIVNSIKSGTTGNITLHANWTSNRNKATSYSDYEDPIIIEDADNGDFLFVYSIGKIDNVPLSEIQYIGNTQEIEINKEYSVTDTITESSAETISNMVANATTKSSGWTLSEDWNETYDTGSEYSEEVGKSEERTDSIGNTTGGNYYISNSTGGSTYSSSDSGGSSSNSAKVTTDESVGINANYSSSTETGSSDSFNMATEIGSTISAGIEVPGANMGAELSATLSTEMNSEETRKDETTNSGGNETINATGTVDESNTSSTYNASFGSTNDWNSTTGYEESYEQSQNTEVTDLISELISEKYTYNVSESTGGENSTTESATNSSSSTDEYSTTLQYSQGNETTSSETITFSSDRPGYYRLVNAGTVHVFAVVGYDVATASYYTYCYNVLDDNTYVYLDYSKDNANFNDCENGIVDFEVPHYVNEYIAGVVGLTDGLEFDIDTGCITDYTGDSKTVTVPQYYSADNGDGTYSAVKVLGFEEDTFKGNTDIETVMLPWYVTEIPDNAFENCSSLETLISFGATSIGENAFKGCTSLGSFTVDKYITSLGDNAFDGIDEVKVEAVNASVVDATIDSGASKITLNLSSLKDSYDDNNILIEDDKEYFGLISDGSTYNNLSVESNAKETFISNITFANNLTTPLELSSSEITLNRTNVENAQGFALIMTNDNVALDLYSTVKLTSASDNTILCKNIDLAKANVSVSSQLSVTGNILICGEIENESMVNITDGNIISITENQFENYLTPINIIFNANEGSVSQVSKEVTYGQKYGELPTPTRDNYTFDGWYTELNGGTLVDENTVAIDTEAKTLYAHWTLNSFVVTFNANGGSCSETSRSLVCNESFGTLPVPTRDYYTFKGWYTATTGGTLVTSATTYGTAVDCTIYAQWEQNSVSSWVKASSVPSDAQIISTKWTYDLTSYTTSSSSSLSGWTKYNSSWEWGSYGSWSSWSDSKYTESDSRDVDTQEVVSKTNYTTIYNYYRYATSKTGSYGSYTKSTSYPTLYTYTFEDELSYTDSTGGGRYKYWYSSSNYISVYADDPYTTQEVESYEYKTQYRYRDRSKIYTYYFSKVESKESTSYPTGSNISNIVEWVQYRAK